LELQEITVARISKLAEAGSIEKKPKAAGGRVIVRTTLSEQTYEALKERILDQTLEPGARLNIDSLSRELDVSSSPIREALARLEAERLVVSELYSGYAVAPKPSAQYLADLLEYRIVIEAHCALLGAPRKDPQILGHMHQAFDRMAAIPRLGTRYREYRRFVQADAWFHQLLVDSACNEVMSTTYESLHAILIQSRLYRTREGGSAPSSEVMQEHAVILEAFDAGDGPAAQAAVRRHLEGGRRRLISREFARAAAGEPHV
jgi:DNA-binding GntR family transcriptional regulator